MLWPKETHYLRTNQHVPTIGRQSDYKWANTHILWQNKLVGFVPIDTWSAYLRVGISWAIGAEIAAHSIWNISIDVGWKKKGESLKNWLICSQTAVFIECSYSTINSWIKIVGKQPMDEELPQNHVKIKGINTQSALKIIAKSLKDDRFDKL